MPKITTTESAGSRYLGSDLTGAIPRMRDAAKDTVAT